MSLTQFSAVTMPCCRWAILSLPQWLCPAFGGQYCRCHSGFALLIMVGNTVAATVALPCLWWAILSLPVALPCLLWWAILSLPQWLCPAYGGQYCRCHKGFALLLVGNTVAATVALPCFWWAILSLPQWLCPAYYGGQYCRCHSGFALLIMVGNTVAATVALPCLLWWAIPSLPQWLCPAYGGQYCRCHKGFALLKMRSNVAATVTALLMVGNTVAATMTPALRWAAMRAILMFINCEGQSYKTVSTDHNS